MDALYSDPIANNAGVLLRFAESTEIVRIVSLLEKKVVYTGGCLGQ